MGPQEVEAALADARARLLHDLVATSLDQAASVDLLDDALHERRGWVDHWPAGAAFLTCLVAQDLKEGLADSRGRWPLCPVDASHELQVEPDLGDDPYWVCEECAVAVAQVGDL
ncbi:MAG: hypothetical protein WAN48_09400 [Actinomycetes bacterium]